MRILLVNDGFGDAGGVQTYLDGVAGGLARRGHALAFLHRDLNPAPFAAAATGRLPQFSVAHEGIERAIDRVAQWEPDVCFSHNMNLLDVDRALVGRWDVVKFMHGYFGTCIGAQKRHGFPVAAPCSRRFGPACLALYGPRHCGELRVGAFVRHYRWAREQHNLLGRYRAIVVASEHMKREFGWNGVPLSQIHVNPLFPTHDWRPSGRRGRGAAPGRGPTGPPAAETAVGHSLSDRTAEAAAETDRAADGFAVAFMGRMTALKGGDLLVRAMADAGARLGRTLTLVTIGDGPQRAAWERLAAECGVPCEGFGWLTGDARWTALARASVLAVPSTWPEPFGLVGLEAAALGIPAIAFDVGGVREWLRPGSSGYLVPGDPPRASAFADALVRAASRPDDLAAMGRGASAVAREMSLDRHLDRLETLLGDGATR